MSEPSNGDMRKVGREDMAGPGPVEVYSNGRWLLLANPEEQTPGWRPVPAIPGGNEDVHQCMGVLCGAFTRADGREGHDRSFHEADKPASIRHWDFRLALVLLAADGDVADDGPCRFDHHGDCQNHGHTDFKGECPTMRARALVAKYGVTPEEVDAL